MRPTSGELIQSIVSALESQVAPQVQDKWAASVLRSAAQLLKHLAVRTEEEGRVLIEDNQDARQVLEAIAPRLLGAAAAVELCATMQGALNMADPAPYDSVALGVRNDAYQWAVERLVRHRDVVRDAGVHDELHAYLQRRLKRERHLYFPVFTGPPF